MTDSEDWAAMKDGYELKDYTIFPGDIVRLNTENTCYLVLGFGIISRLDGAPVVKVQDIKTMADLVVYPWRITHKRR